MGLRKLFRRWNAYNDAARELSARNGSLTDLGLGDIDRMGQNAPATTLWRLGR